MGNGKVWLVTMIDIANILPEVYRIARERRCVKSISLSFCEGNEVLIIDDHEGFTYMVTVDCDNCQACYTMRDIDNGLKLVCRHRFRLSRFVNLLTLEEIASMVLDDIFE